MEEKKNIFDENENNNLTQPYFSKNTIFPINDNDKQKSNELYILQSNERLPDNPVLDDHKELSLLIDKNKFVSREDKYLTELLFISGAVIREALRVNSVSGTGYANSNVINTYIANIQPYLQLPLTKKKILTIGMHLKNFIISAQAQSPFFNLLGFKIGASIFHEDFHQYHNIDTYHGTYKLEGFIHFCNTKLFYIDPDTNPGITLTKEENEINYSFEGQYVPVGTYTKGKHNDNIYMSVKTSQFNDVSPEENNNWVFVLNNNTQEQVNLAIRTCTVIGATFREFQKAKIINKKNKLKELINELTDSMVNISNSKLFNVLYLFKKEISEFDNLSFRNSKLFKGYSLINKPTAVIFNDVFLGRINDKDSEDPDRDPFISDGLKDIIKFSNLSNDAQYKRLLCILELFELTLLSNINITKNGVQEFLKLGGILNKTNKLNILGNLSKIFYIVILSILILLIFYLIYLSRKTMIKYYDKKKLNYNYIINNNKGDYNDFI